MSTILAIDDQPFILKSLSRLLTSEGFQVLIAENGYLGILKIVNEIPDLIILDLNMPIMDGFTLIEKVKKSEVLKNIPIIILTCFHDMEFIKRCQSQGVNDYIIKPYDQQELLKRIKKLLNEHSAARKPDGIVSTGEQAEDPGQVEKSMIKEQTSHEFVMKVGQVEQFKVASVSELEPGQIIGIDVKSNGQLVLLSRGTIVTNVVIKRLQELGVEKVYIQKEE